MRVYWAEHAILSNGLAAGVRIVEEHGRVAALTVDAAPEGKRLPGLVLPGFANGHSHAFHRALRGTTHAGGGSFWSWRDHMYAVAATLTPDSYRDLATAVFAEMVLAGYTAVGEFHYVHGEPDGKPYEREAAMERAVLDAAAKAGIRITLLDTLYLEGGVGTSLDERQHRFSDGSIEKWRARRGTLEDGATVKIGSAIHSVRAVTPDAITAVAELEGGIVHAHVSEQPAENEQALRAWGATPVELLSDLLGPRFTAVHATHLTPFDIGALADSFVCMCPTTERDLADGIGPARELASSGSRLTLGSDQNAVIDPFEELRGLEMNERLRSGQRGRFSPGELLAAATTNGYASLGWADSGIEVGGLCDIVAVSTNSPRTAGASLDQLWLAATSADVTDVIVHGQHVVTEGRHRLGNVAELLRTTIEGSRTC